MPSWRMYRALGLDCAACMNQDVQETINVAVIRRCFAKLPETVEFTSRVLSMACLYFSSRFWERRVGIPVLVGRETVQLRESRRLLPLRMEIWLPSRDVCTATAHAFGSLQMGSWFSET